MDKDEYLEAWTEEGASEKKDADPVVEAVKAARKADDEAFADAFKNDNFGIDIDRVAKQGDELIEKEDEKV